MPCPRKDQQTCTCAHAHTYTHTKIGEREDVLPYKRLRETEQGWEPIQWELVMEQTGSRKTVRGLNVNTAQPR